MFHVVVKEEFGIPRQRSPVTIGLPFPQGAVRDLSCIRVLAGTHPVPAQLSEVCSWPDHSLQWVHARILLDLEAGEEMRLTIEVDLAKPGEGEALVRGIDKGWQPQDPELAGWLAPGGVLAAIEPVFGGLIEHPPEIATRDLWLAGLERAGADPCIGRKLPGILAAAGFRVRVDLLERLMPPSPLRFDLLDGLPLDEAERAALARAEKADALLDDSSPVVHLPMFLILAEVGQSE